MLNIIFCVFIAIDLEACPKRLQLAKSWTEVTCAHISYNIGFYTVVLNNYIYRSVIISYYNRTLHNSVKLRGNSFRSWCDGSSDRSFTMDPLGYFSFQPVRQNWCNILVCGM